MRILRITGSTQLEILEWDNWSRSELDCSFPRWHQTMAEYRFLLLFFFFFSQDLYHFIIWCVCVCGGEGAVEFLLKIIFPP